MKQQQQPVEQSAEQCAKSIQSKKVRQQDSQPNRRITTLRSGVKAGRMPM